jgi:hypothetical protein
MLLVTKWNEVKIILVTTAKSQTLESKSLKEEQI